MKTATNTPAADDAAAPSTSSGRQLRRPMTWLKEAGGSAGALAAVLSLIFLVRPGCQPTVDQPPTEQAGAIADLVAGPMTYGEHLRRLGARPPDPRSPELVRPGYQVSFSFRITGYAGQRLPVRWAIIDRDLGRQAAASPRNGQFLVPDATTDQATSPALWLPAPPGDHIFIVEVSVYQPNGQFPLAPAARSGPLAGADSRTFGGTQ